MNQESTNECAGPNTTDGVRKSPPKLTVVTEYGTFARRTWRPYQFVLLVHGPAGTRAESWTEGARGDLRGEYSRLVRLATKMAETFRLRELNRARMSWVPADFRAADYNFTIHAVATGDEVWGA